MSNHYFIGIRLPEDVAGSLAEQRDEWRLNSHKLQVPAEDMHITLVYIGADPQQELPEVLKALEAVEIDSFDVTINGAGTFGSPATPRVVFGKVLENPALRELQRQVAEALEPFSLRPDKRPYVPHVTLAKKWKGKEPISQPLDLGMEKFAVNEFSVFKVNLDRTPRYEPVQTYPLGNRESK